MPRSMTSGGSGGLLGAASRNYNPASGGIPGVTSPIDAITGNLGGLGGIISSITGTQSGALRSQYPAEYFSTLGTLLGNVGRRARGDISDLLPELQQSSAERAVYGGMSGSQAENTKLLRDLGLTRYGVENQALQDLSSIQGQIPKVSPFDPTGIIAAQLAAQERADMYAAAPVPEEAYLRALGAAGGTGRTTPGLSYNFGRGGGGRVVDTALRGYAPSIPQYGTNYSAGAGGGYSPIGAFQNVVNNFTADDREGPTAVSDWTTWFPSTDQDFGGSLQYGGQDFGGSLDYAGGAPWNPLDEMIGGFGGTDYGAYEDLGLTGGDFYDELY